MSKLEKLKNNNVALNHTLSTAATNFEKREVESPEEKQKQNVVSSSTSQGITPSQSHADSMSIEEVFNLMRHIGQNESAMKFICPMITSTLGNSNKKTLEEALANAGKVCIDTLNAKGVNLTPQMVKFLRLELSSTFGMFSSLIQSGYSDMILTYDRMTLSSHILGKQVINVPSDVLEVYHYLILHMIDNVIFYNGKKFDPGNAILDAQMEGVRFNVAHACLNTLNDFPVVVMRVQTVSSNSDKSKSIIINEQKYLDSIGASERQRELLNECSMGKNFFIFGTVGSGKTVLLKYLANKNLEKKNNLCTIEDTAELFVPTNLALKTNAKYSIKDLFTASLRQNPSHLYIGETRTDDIIDILESGLAFSIGSTIHATSIQKAIERIFFMSLKRKIDRQSVMSLIAASVDVFIFMDKLRLKGMWEKDVRADVDYTNLSKLYIPVE